MPGIVVAGVIAKPPPFAIRDFVLADIEGVELDGVHGPLARLAVADVVAHPERAGWHVDEIAEAIVDGLRGSAMLPSPRDDHHDSNQGRRTRGSR